MKLTRNRDGSRYHRLSCRHADPELRWTWALGRTRAQVATEADALGVAACRTCRPLADARDEAHVLRHPDDRWTATWRGFTALGGARDKALDALESLLATPLTAAAEITWLLPTASEADEEPR